LLTALAAGEGKTIPIGLGGEVVANQFISYLILKLGNKVKPTN
jgi:hypothetical protein